MHAAGFNASTDGGVQDLGAAQAANGIAGMVWVDAYNNVTCAQTKTNAAIAAMVQANVTAGKTGLRYQIGDEPTANGCKAAAVYTSITQAVHAVDPTAKTWADIDQFQVGSPVQAGVPMYGTVDIIAYAGTAAAPKVYCDYAVLLRYGRAWLRLLQTDDDEAGFAEQLGRARSWIDDLAHSHFRVASMVMVAIRSLDR